MREDIAGERCPIRGHQYRKQGDGHGRRGGIVRDLVSPMWRTTWDAHGMVGNLTNVSTSRVYGCSPLPALVFTPHFLGTESWGLLVVAAVTEPVIKEGQRRRTGTGSGGAFGVGARWGSSASSAGRCAGARRC